MKISKTSIYLCIALMAMTGCNDQTETNLRTQRPTPRTINQKIRPKAKNLLLKNLLLKKKHILFKKHYNLKVYRSM
jgi:hypothetical protein